MDYAAALNWRYASKKMNGKAVPADKLANILESIRLSPSSAGLQPYKVFVISDHLLKGKIHEQACPQPQVLEGSHLLVFASYLKFTGDMVDESMKLIADTRNVGIETLAPFSDSIKGGIVSRTDEKNAAWAARQAYIGLGFGIFAAAIEAVDATPMEGFNNAALDKLLDLPARGLQSVVLLALGYRDAEKDFLSVAKKVRKPASDFFVTL